MDFPKFPRNLGLPASRDGVHVIIEVELPQKKVKSVLQRKEKIHKTSKPVLQEAGSWVKELGILVTIHCGQVGGERHIAYYFY